MDFEQSGRTKNRSAAILASDVVGYSRLMEAYEDATHVRLMKLHFEIMQPIVERHGGRIVKNTGDGFLAMFDTPHSGLSAAQDLQRAIFFAERNAPIECRIAFRWVCTSRMLLLRITMFTGTASI